MRAHFLQHVPFEGLGSIETWLRSVHAEITSTKFFQYPTLPSINSFDLLIVIGGSMSANDEAHLPWLVSEKRLIREAVAQEKAVIGICLGAQLIASAMGAVVYPNPETEIGWFPVYGLQNRVQQRLFSFPEQSLVFHWHGDAFDLPRGAVKLACSNACKNQAFQLGKRVIGLQFHLETTPESLRDLVQNCRSELMSAPYIQSEAEILAVDASTYNAINSMMVDVLNFVTSDED